MAAAAQDRGGSLSVHEVLCRWAPAYLAQFGAAMPSRQREVLQALLACRTPALGGALHYCPNCDHRHFSYHSCNDRHCPQCGGQDAQQWLEENAALLLPVHYFLVTFTVPEGLRRWIRSHPRLGYDLLLAASSQALQDLAQNPKRLGATLGLLGVLHTWTRTLEYHPHVHYLVPGGGLSLDQRQWISSRPRFLLPVKALSDRCRTLFRQALQKQMPEALADLPPKVWQQRWVVHSAATGSGQNALRYLSRYVFKTATGNRQLQLLPNGRLRWPFRHSGTGAWQPYRPRTLRVPPSLPPTRAAGRLPSRAPLWLVASGRARQAQPRARPAQNPAPAFSRRASRLATSGPEPDPQPRSSYPARRSSTAAATALSPLRPPPGPGRPVAPGTRLARVASQPRPGVQRTTRPP